MFCSVLVFDLKDFSSSFLSRSDGSPGAPARDQSSQYRHAAQNGAHGAHAAETALLVIPMHPVPPRVSLVSPLGLFCLGVRRQTSQSGRKTVPPPPDISFREIGDVLVSARRDVTQHV